ncbi:MAG: hypothetical protein IK997_03275 [Bacilli bacterium]|nr:hypothetical protein [Bacilli bacterium]
MNKIMESEILTLENNEEYICVARIEDNEDSYLALISNTKPISFRFAKEIIEGDDVTLEIVYDQDEKEKVLKLYEEEIRKRI